jgi:hypothetical protein
VLLLYVLLLVAMYPFNRCMLHDCLLGTSVV